MHFNRLNTFFIVFVTVSIVFELRAQEVKNVITGIEGKKIIVSFDLTGKNPNSICDVKIYFGGRISQKNLLVNATGDFGPGIKVGYSKQVTISDLTPFIPYKEELTFKIEAVYTHVPNTGAISVVTVPAGARIYLDDEFAGNSELLLTYKNTGTHRIRIEKEGFLNIEKDIRVLDGRTSTVTETLTPGYAAIIVSDPEKANILVNGIDMGKTPVQATLKPGENNIKISAKYYNRFSTVITPKEQDEKFEFTLIKTEYPVSIITYPEKTNVNLNGINYTDYDNLKVTGESKKLMISKNHYKTHKSTIDIRDVNKIQRFQFLLEPEVYRKKGAAMVYSLLLPGMGQHYLKRKGIEPVMGVIGYGLLAGSMNQYNNAVKSYDLYLEKTDMEGRADLNQQWQNEKQQSEYMLYGAAAIWAGNLLWTLLSIDEEDRYQKIKTEIKIDNLTNTGGISLVFQLGNE